VTALELRIDDPDAMGALGARLASRLDAGDLVALNGDLGAGKTTLTRGLGAALGVRGAVTSPTFVLARTHPRVDGAAPLVHVDAYRLATALELDDLDLDWAGSIVVVEWGAGKLDGVAESWLELDLERDVDGAPVDVESDAPAPRRVRVTGHGPKWADLSFLSAVE
jgi:tRNA threonylcarbamoyladenosine biosynthesis protein TsaE